MTGTQDAVRRPSGRPLRLIIVLAAALVVAILASLLVWSRGDDPATTSAERPRTPIAATVGRIGDGPVEMGGTTTITGHALAAGPLSRLELWAGTDLVAERQNPTPSPALHATWDWTPTAPGQTILFVRAVDDAGRVAQSGVLRLDVEGDPSAAVPGIVRAASTSPPAPAPFSAPAPRVALDGCTVRVSAPGTRSVSGLGVFEVGPSAAAFALGTTLPPAGGVWSTPVGPGDHLFTLSAFRDDIEVQSRPVKLHVPDDCGGVGWTGDVRLVNGKLVVPEAVDRAYFYLTVGGGNARRVPDDPPTFIEPDAHGDLVATPYLPPPQAGPIELEAWGWRDGSLHKLGTGSWHDPAPTPPTDPLALAPHFGMASATDLAWVEKVVIIDDGTIDELHDEGSIIRPGTGSPKPDPRTFRWSTAAGNLTKVVWQVFLYDAGISSDIDPPFTIDSGVLAVEPGTMTGDFTLDMASYLGALAIPSGSLPDSGTAPAAQASSFWNPGPPPPGGSALANVGFAGVGVGPATGDGGGGATAIVVPEHLMLPTIDDLWVRVVPVAAGVPLPSSNTVHFDVVEPTNFSFAAPMTDRFGLSFSAEAPLGADPKFVRCAVVTELTSQFDPQTPILGPLYANAYKTGQPLCYHPPKKGWTLVDVFDAFVEFVADAWDAVSEAWDDIQDLVVKGVLAVVPCDQFANASTCDAIAHAALSAALVAVGIPPSIPDFDTAVAAMKGDLTQAMIEAAGLEDVCDAATAANQADGDLPTCQDVVDAALDEVTAQVKSSQSKAAANAVGISPPKGVVLAPDPRGIWHAPKFTVTATRLSPEPLPASGCLALVSIASTVTDHHWKELITNQYGNYDWVDKQGTVTGAPFHAESFLLPDIPVGSSITQDVYLVKGERWWESQAARNLEEYYAWESPYFDYADTPAHTWVLLQKGAQLTYKVDSACALPATGSGVLTSSGYGG